jgi:CelD/BcsL family acetyltransferase involved in cellulose biosynthesis
MFVAISPNRRSKIRRSFKEYEKQETLEVSTAASIDEALAYFHALGTLHTQRWNRVGIAGSFAQPSWVAFHQDVIKTAFPREEIQLLRIGCGKRDIGYIYNVLWRGAVLMLQSGFAP